MCCCRQTVVVSRQISKLFGRSWRGKGQDLKLVSRVKDEELALLEEKEQEQKQEQDRPPLLSIAH